MTLIIIALHVVACVALILIVLLQRGKGADMGAVFGGSSQTIFGSAGATPFLHKVTTIVAIVFMFTSLGLSFLFGKGPRSSVMEGVGTLPAATATSPAATENPPAAPSGEAPASQ